MLSTASTDASYHEILRDLSEGSVHRHFDPYLDIDWDSPDFAVDPTDTRWIMPDEDPLGRHPWYKAQPVERQIAMGMWRQAGIAKVGLDFEQLLIRGLMQYLISVPNGDPEFRYVTHEAAEECNHTMMFQEMINRIGEDVVGMGSIDRKLTMIIWPAVKYFPALFFTMVLGGEEPIDHLQKSVLRAGEDMHPMVQRVMQIHVAEEARHISFAHEYLRRNVPGLHPVPKFVLSLGFPVAMRVMLGMIMTPPKEFVEKFEIPAHVMRDAYWNAPQSRATKRSIFGDVRALCTDVGLMNPVAKAAWRLLGIDGPVSRYRSEPDRTLA
ncbi:diiron oxygenase [Nocardia puris]|uniref:Para-aminobenzoate N-oxygenase AurF n=1 Tax=Nocardia puris TaxID=208602 RepID=A0A366D930_9NOCA|nr:diiron oxygenase [Nocardia puris]MBF6214043.1 diiron oxygenase [Nocardia puris]MBF6368673.1 diiron oxygenase [Nocardia puris]MBF6461575.1 diiron oxygenase [Nocardia puris]RBO86550.1 para-aminobenzoate N-oxygenase AurF [Nocardia puris]